MSNKDAVVLPSSSEVHTSPQAATQSTLPPDVSSLPPDVSLPPSDVYRSHRAMYRRRLLR